MISPLFDYAHGITFCSKTQGKIDSNKKIEYNHENSASNFSLSSCSLEGVGRGILDAPPRKLPFIALV